ncbi:hypothetical protein C8J56DRAFT_890227 [Mycena floridula]|nr:hypothetical protein C8J56DRAFT_890227 [Mycena floridula]
MSFPNFKVSIQIPLSSPIVPSVPSAEPIFGVAPLSAASINVVSTPIFVGSFGYDSEHGYDLEWDNMIEMEEWLHQQQQSRGFELKLKDTTPKVPGKRVAGGCPCRLTIKSYPGTHKVLGHFIDKHSHQIGQDNLIYMNISHHIREKGIKRQQVLKQIKGDTFSEANLTCLRSVGTERDQNITARDIRCIEKVIEEELIRFVPNDGHSVLEWSKKLRDEGCFVFLKGTSDPVPQNCVVELKTFIFIVQTLYQLECWQRFGHGKFAGLDATHNTTHYSDMSLFTLISHDKWGHELWDLLKRWIRVTNESEFQAMWEKIQSLGFAPPSMVEYLQKTWLPVRDMWSAIYHVNHSIDTENDTNMLVEAWHHLLKSKFLEGKRNRRLDHLIYILVIETIPYFIERHYRQGCGWAGLNRELERRQEIEERAKSIPKNAITLLSASEKDTAVFRVNSLTKPNVWYEVDLESYECNCLSFTGIHFCKHLGAVQIHFPEAFTVVSTEELANAVSTSLSEPIPAKSGGAGTDDGLHMNDITETDHDIDVDSDALLSSLITKLQAFQQAPKDARRSLPAESLAILHSHISSVLVNISSADILPPKTKVPPNKKSGWATETAPLMGVHVKTAHKSKFSDPHSGGAASGSLAKPDAKKRRLNSDSPVTQLSVAPVASATATSSSATAAVPFPFTFMTPFSSMASLPVTHSSQLSTYISSDPLDFDATTFDIGNKPALEKLLRKHLRALCRVYDVKEKGGNLDIAAQLYEKRSKT